MSFCFVFKQKSAYEMLIGDWSSDVCSSDLLALRRHRDSRDNLFACEYRVRHRDGGWRWMLDRAVSRRDANGRVERIVGSVSDITDRKSMEIQQHGNAWGRDRG